MDIPLSGEMLDSQEVDYTVRLYFSGDFFVRIESPFTLNLPDGRILLSPEEDESQAFSPLSDLVGHVVAESTIDDAGVFTVVFENGSSLVAKPDKAYEAWTLNGPNGLLVVCMPGGELAVWDAASNAEVDKS